MRASHPVQIVLKVGESVAVGIAVVVGSIRVCAYSLLPPVRHTILVGIPVGITMLLSKTKTIEALTAIIGFRVDKTSLAGAATLS